MSAPFAEKTFKNFDGSESCRSRLFAPDRYRILESIFKEPGTFSVQGAGLSYAPLSFGEGSSVIQLGDFNRVLSFDQTSGVIEVESGMTLGALAQVTIPKGWYLKVQPGHPSITVGGCLAADVHGKNQFQDLNFKEQVLFFNLYHPDKGFIFCDRSTNVEVFHLTCGGLGLTGIIISIGIQLGKLESHLIETETLLLKDIFQLPALLNERSTKDDLLYSWHDFNAQNEWGSGFLKIGRYRRNSQADVANLEKELKLLENVKPLRSESRGRIPLNLLNPLSVRAMNLAYSMKELKGSRHGIQPLVEFLFPVVKKTVYFELFGKKGFHESQVLIPSGSFEFVLKELKLGLRKFSVPVTLGSCKLFKGQQELLRFIGDGIVLAINFPRCKESLRLLEWWDSVIVEAKCIPNLSKDSRLSSEVVQKCYPQFNEFQSRLHKWDPKRLFQTSLSKRLHL